MKPSLLALLLCLAGCAAAQTVSDAELKHIYLHLFKPQVCIGFTGAECDYSYRGGSVCETIAHAIHDVYLTSSPLVPRMHICVKGLVICGHGANIQIPDIALPIPPELRKR